MSKGPRDGAYVFLFSWLNEMGNIATTKGDDSKIRAELTLLHVIHEKWLGNGTLITEKRNVLHDSETWPYQNTGSVGGGVGPQIPAHKRRLDFVYACPLNPGGKARGWASPLWISEGTFHRPGHGRRFYTGWGVPSEISLEVCTPNLVL